MTCGKVPSNRLPSPVHKCRRESDVVLRREVGVHPFLVVRGALECDLGNARRRSLLSRLRFFDGSRVPGA